MPIFFKKKITYLPYLTSSPYLASYLINLLINLIINAKNIIIMY
jgi:hypothetical protein